MVNVLFTHKIKILVAEKPIEKEVPKEEKVQGTRVVI